MKKIIKTAIVLMATVFPLLAGDLTTDKLTAYDTATFYGDVIITNFPTIPPTNGLVMYLKFDTNSTSVADQSGFNHGATVYNGAIWTNGISGGAFWYDGTNDYCETTNNIGISGASVWTMSCWVKLQTNGLEADNIMSMGVNSGGAIFDFSKGGSNNTININIWNSYNENNINCGMDLTTSMVNIVATYDGTAGSLYVNGLLKKTKTIPLNISNQPIRLGGKPGGYAGQYGRQIIDEARVYNRCLNMSEIRSLYYQYAASISVPQLIVPSITASNSIQQVSATATNTFMGDVGVGTATPTAKLDVNGSAIIQGNLSVNGTANLTATNATALSGHTADAFVQTNHTGNVFINGSITHIEKYGNLDMGVYTNN